MIILIIFGATALGLIITGITLKAVAHNMRRKQTREGWVFAPRAAELDESCLWLLAPLVFVITGLIVTGVCAIVARVGTTRELDYIQTQSQYEVLIYRVENQKDHVLEDVELYNDIVEYNTAIRKKQKLIDSKWVGIFYDKSIAKCKEIDLSAFGKKDEKQSEVEE